jgi:hypothetical protein
MNWTQHDMQGIKKLKLQNEQIKIKNLFILMLN